MNARSCGRLVSCSGLLMAMTFHAPAQHPIMRLSAAEKSQLMAAHFTAPQATHDRSLQKTFASSLSLLSRLPYVPAERNQQVCGDCWQWAATGMLEIAHQVQSGVYDRLSVQFINSCAPHCGCNGGFLSDFTSFYATKGFAIPWSNLNAQYYQAYPMDGTCGNMPACGTIGTVPRYPITSIAPASITTFGAGRAQAIANIKSVLNQNQGVWFAFFMGTGADWLIFDNFWSAQPESAVWTNFYCGQVYDSNNGGGGHAVLCVGYNEDDPANPYWIMVNSWGTTPQRPNGLFRVGMNLNYDCIDASGEALLAWEAMNVQFGDRPTGAPSIYIQPADQTTTVGGGASFNVSASGSQPLSYSWYRDGAAIAGATQSAYAVSNLQLADSGARFSCLVSNSYGTALSSAGTVIVLSGTAEVILFDDLTAANTPVPSGYHSITWANLVCNDVHASNVGGYRAGMISANNVLYNGKGTPATLTSALPFNLISAYLTAAWNDNLQVQVKGYVSGALTYDHTYTLSATAPTLIYFNYNGVTQVEFIPSGGTAHPGYTGTGTHFILDNLAISPGNTVAPQLTAQSFGVTANAGANVSFSVNSLGNVPLAYSWRRNGVPVAGANQSCCTVTNVQLSDSGSQFSCLISNSYGTAQSTEAMLVVLPPGADVIHFDDLPGTTLSPVPNGYRGLTWNNVNFIDAHAVTGSGYRAAMVSPNQAAINAWGNPAAITSSGSFNLVSAYVTAAWNDNLQLEVRGYASGSLAYDRTYTLSATAPTLIRFNYAGVNRVEFASSGGTTHAGYNGTGTQFAIDNLAVAPATSSVQPPVFGGCTSLNSQIQLTLYGTPTSNYVIYVSSDLKTWNLLNTVQTTNGSAVFVDSTTSPAPRFYRAKAQ
jgi:hypothetical protein